MLTVDGVGEDPGADVEDEVIEAIEEAIEEASDVINDVEVSVDVCDVIGEAVVDDAASLETDESDSVEEESVVGGFDDAVVGDAALVDTDEGADVEGTAVVDDTDEGEVPGDADEGAVVELEGTSVAGVDDAEDAVGVDEGVLFNDVGNAEEDDVMIVEEPSDVDEEGSVTGVGEGTVVEAKVGA